MMPSATELGYFVEVAATQNISRASERLGISQPSLSLGIKRLENHIGTPLFIRSKTGVKLTRAGQRFRTNALELLEQWQLVVQSVKRDDDEIAGCYKIGAHVSVARNRLSSVLADFLHLYPRVEFQVHHDLSRKVVEKLISFELDFAVAVNPVPHPDLVIRQVYSDEVGFFAAKPIDGKDKTGQLLCFDPDLAQSKWLLKSAKEAGLSFNRFFVSSSLDVLADVCSKGAGVAILPRGVVSYMDNSLVQVLCEIPTFKDSHALVYRSDPNRSVASKALVRALEKALSK